MRRIIVVVVAFLVLEATTGQVGPAVYSFSQTCSTTLSPDQSIQFTIANAHQGDTICLKGGIWQENLKIEKSVTLRGMGAKLTLIKGAEWGYPVIWIKGASTTPVEISNLTVSAAETGCAKTDQHQPLCAAGLWIQGKAVVTVSNIIVSSNPWNGIELRNSAKAIISSSIISENVFGGIMLRNYTQVELFDSVISENGLEGVQLRDSAQTFLSECKISENGLAGILLRHSAEITLSDSRISGNGKEGIKLQDSTQAMISSSIISKNSTNGIAFWNKSQATLSNSTISGNAVNGVRLRHTAEVAMRESALDNNGTSDNCKKRETLCNGLELTEGATVAIADVRVHRNSDWGLGAVLKHCGYAENSFFGRVIFQDMELEYISDNNISGNQDGVGNPGDQPWKSPTVEPGQVCLP